MKRKKKENQSKKIKKATTPILIKKLTNRRKSMQHQILLPFLILIILTGSIIAFMNYRLSTNAMVDQLADNVVNEVGNLNDTLDLFLINTEDVLDRRSEERRVGKECRYRRSRDQ